ncbi:MAG: sigma-70 family RNA polymerase sigma factor [Anaerolineae bacterium]
MIKVNIGSVRLQDDRNGRDEKTLLRLAHDLDEGALAEIFDTYYVPLYRYIYHHVGHVQTAEDLTARVFQRMLEKLHAGRGPRHHLKGWLYRVAHNVIIDETRRQGHRSHAPLDEHIPDADAAPEEQAQQAILAEHARRALMDLAPRQRAAVTLRYLMGLNNEEVARSLGLSVGAVKALQHRGLDTLRRRLAAGVTAGVAEGSER